MKEQHIELKNGTAVGVCVPLPKAPLLLIKAEKGFVMCGYLNIQAANKAGEVAARASGVKTLDDLMRAPVTEVTDRAKELGVTEGMTGEEALELMFTDPE